MADEIIVEQPNIATQQSFELPVDLKSQMDLALGLNQGEQNQQQQQASNDVNSGTSEKQAVVEPFKFETFTEKFGFQTPEDAIAEIEGLRAFKAQPPVAAEPIWKEENESSKKIFESLKAGKIDEVYNFLDEQRKLDKLTTAEVTKDNAAEIVKFGMQLKNKDLTAQEIDRLFNRKFQIPAKPVFDEVNDDEAEFKQKLNIWENQVEEVNMDISIEAKMFKPDLDAAKNKLVLPDIQQSLNPELDAFNKYQEDILEAEKIGVEAKKEFSAFTAKQSEIKVPFKDEANKIDFSFSFEPDEVGWSTAKEMAIDSEKFLSSYFDKDGNPNRKEYLEDIYFAKNKVKIIAEAIAQGKNAAIKATLPDNQGNNRQITQISEPSELDKQMQMAGITRG